MKKSLKLPTLLGLIILVFSVIVGVGFINSRQMFKIGANTEVLPKNVRVSNITDTSATITWTTDAESSGFVKWGKSETSLGKVALEENSLQSFVHSVTIIGDSSNQQLFFTINSNGKDYKNDGVVWKLNTLPAKTNNLANILASGSILNSDGSTPAKAIAYLNINGILLSGLTSDAGNFVIPISNYIDQITDTQAIEITIQGGYQGTSHAVIYPKSIASIPAIVLGKTYDFRTAENISSNQKPESSLSIPESVEHSSRFEVTKNEITGKDQKNISIDSVDEGEIITTINPEFFGVGPKNTEIIIEVQSELQTANISTNSKWNWKWSPPNNLAPGEHKLIVKWRDASGILRTLTRTFVVTAAEGPAFESTPSATPENNSSTVTPTAKPLSTPIITSSPIATKQPVPKTGDLTPTIGLFIMGIGLLFGSIFVFKYQHA